MKFQFVDNIRFYAIFSIVIFHSCLIFLEFNKNDIIYTFDNQVILLSLMQFVRFGNICFFMVSGFLFGNNMSKANNIKLEGINYVKRRWELLKVPTLLFSTILACLGILIPLGKYIIKGESISLTSIVSTFLINYFFGYTWFIYNLFIGFLLILLMLFIPKISKWLIFLTLFIALFWGLNPYLKLLNINQHMFTLFGFSFYLLFGYWLGKKYLVFKKIIDYFRNNKIIYLLLFIIITFLSYCESYYLYNFTNIAPFYNLKLSSQLQSILIFFGFCAYFQKPLYPKFLNPKVETVGIYFIHSILLNVVYFSTIAFFIYFFNIKGKEDIPQLYLPYCFVISSVVIYFLSVVIVRIIVNTKYSYLLGIKK